MIREWITPTNHKLTILGFREWNRVALIAVYYRWLWWKRMSIPISFLLQSRSYIAMLPPLPVSMTFSNAPSAPIQCTLQFTRSVLLSESDPFFGFSNYAVNLCWLYLTLCLCDLLVPTILFTCYFFYYLRWSYMIIDERNGKILGINHFFFSLLFINLYRFLLSLLTSIYRAS